MKNLHLLKKKVSKYGLSQKDVEESIKSACDFFQIPYPRLVQDLTNVPYGQTMFLNWDKNSYDDDVICYNMNQMINMKVDSKEAFSLVMSHECAHRLLQNTRFYGPNNGAWEEELCCDYFMGVRSGLMNMDISKVALGLSMTSGSITHPEGLLRAMFIQYGKYHVQEMQKLGLSLTMPNLLYEFEKYRCKMQSEIVKQQRKYFQM